MYTAVARFYKKGKLVKTVTVEECAAPIGAVKGRITQIARFNGLVFDRVTVEEVR